MHKERVRRNGNHLQDKVLRGVQITESDPQTSSKMLLSFPLYGSSSCHNFIEHRVSKMDTLAGIAIRYGVEISDIKKMNGLVTDRQMYAHHSLQIPLPGRHPPSTILSNNSTKLREIDNAKNSLPSQTNIPLIESLKSLKQKRSTQKVSAAMSSLQNFYGIASNDNCSSEETETTVNRLKNIERPIDDRLIYTSPDHRSNVKEENSKMVNDIPIRESGDGESERFSDNSVRRRQKVDTEKESLPKEDSMMTLNGRTLKSLPRRPKTMSRSSLSTYADSSTCLKGLSMDDAFTGEGYTVFRKSPSTSSLQDSSENGYSGIWTASKWALKPDFQTFSVVTITNSFYDGFTPIISRRNKAALD